MDIGDIKRNEKRERKLPAPLKEKSRKERKALVISRTLSL
jgi:hypothetical protein